MKMPTTDEIRKAVAAGYATWQRGREGREIAGGLSQSLLDSIVAEVVDTFRFAGQPKTAVEETVADAAKRGFHGHDLGGSD